MRFFLLCICSSPLLILGCAKQRPLGRAETRQGDFTLKAEVIEALEGGPVVIHTNLAYHGKNPVELRYAQLGRGVGVDLSTPEGWVPSRGLRAGGPGGIGSSSIMPGEEFSSFVYAHEWFSHIPSGRAALKVKWANQVKGKPAEELSVELPVDVQPATPERIAAVRRQMEAALDRPPLSRVEGDLDRWIYGTWHRAFLPVALRIIEERGFHLFYLLDFCYCLSDAPEEIHARMVALACKPSWNGRVDLFHYWRDRGYDDPKKRDETPLPPVYWEDILYWPAHRTPLPPQEFAKLLNAKHPWTRILTYVTFPARCPQDWTRSLLEDCRQLTQPLPAEQLAPLLRELDDDDFAVREKATAQLEQFGERVEAQLHQALRTDLPPEAKLRLRWLLDRMASAEEDGEWKRILEYVSSGIWARDASINVLRALAQGRPDAELTKAALASLNKLSTPKRGNPDGQR